MNGGAFGKDRGYREEEQFFSEDKNNNKFSPDHILFEEPAIHTSEDVQWTVGILDKIWRKRPGLEM